MRMTMTDWSLLMFLSLLWGGAFFFVGVAVRELPPLTIVGLRTGIAAAVLALVIHWQGEAWPFVGRVVRAFFAMGLLNNLIPFSLLFWAQTGIPSGLAAILNATTPIFSILVAHLVLADERLAAGKAVGVGCGFAGVVVLLGADLAGGPSVATLGIVACLVAALSYGIAGVYGRRFKTMRLSATQVACGQLTATTVMMVPIAAAVDMPWALPVPSLPVAAAVVALAVVSTALAYVVFFRLLASAGAVNATLVTLLIPPSAIVLGAVFLDEVLAPRHYLGMALIGLGLLVIDGRLAAGLRRKHR